MAVRIRQVMDDDLDTCYAIEAACYRSEGATKERIKRRIQIFSEGFLVASHEGRIIGFINSAATDREDITDEALKDMVGHEKEGKNIVIFSVAVHPEFQGRGVSRELMRKFIKASSTMGKEKILLLCKKTLIPYYRKFGFLYGGASTSTHAGFRWHEMYLPLAPSV